MSAPAAIVLAAGAGTRMCSRTPKPLHELCGLPLVLWPVRAARAAGAGRVVVVDGAARALEPVLGEGVELAVQEHPDGTGGAAAAGLALLHGLDPATPVLVLSGDVPLIDPDTLAGLLEAHRAAGAAATMATAVLEDPGGYGRVVRDSQGAFVRVAETKREGDATAAELELREVNTGVFVFDAGALAQALPRLSPENAQRELYLPQALEMLASEGARVLGLPVEDEAAMLGVNDRLELAAVRRIAQARIHERLLRAGVDVVDPQATVIDVDVGIGPDSVIEPFTTIRGCTRIGAGCLVRHSYLVDCELEDGVSVGPFAYLRPGTVLRTGSRVGTFVEVKNSDIGAGAKVPHLSYLGDADVGERANLGAATITANYDGLRGAKHRSRVGANAKTGVDTTLVAPVSVGEDAFTGAGSVITEDVPPGALGIARSRQRNVDGYAGRETESQ